MNRLASLPFDLVNRPPAERPEELTIKRKTAVERADDEVNVVDVSHRAVLPVDAPGRIRTCDTGLRRAVLYPLSYRGRASQG